MRVIESLQDLVPATGIIGAMSSMLSQKGTPGLRYLDYLGRTVPW